jgi:hypothetical protein
LKEGCPCQDTDIKRQASQDQDARISKRNVPALLSPCGVRWGAEAYLNEIATDPECKKIDKYLSGYAAIHKLD